MSQVGLTISNPTKAIYLNAFALGQNIVLQIMATWVCLSTYLLTCPLWNCSIQKAHSSERLQSNKPVWNSHAKKYIFLFRKEKKRKMNDFNLPSRHAKFYVASTSIWRYDAMWTLNRRRRSIWRVIFFDEVKKIHAFFNKIERKAPSETLGKWTITLHGNKLDERTPVDKSSKYTIKAKLTTILGSLTIKLGEINVTLEQAGTNIKNFYEFLW